METYRYYSLPFCKKHSSKKEEENVAEEESISVHTRREEEKREGAVRHRQRLGESIVGDRRESSPYEISFGDSVDWRLLCKKELDTEELTLLKEAIHNNYFFEMFVEDLPMWGYIGDAVDEDLILGEGSQSRTYLFPHLHFYIGHKNGKIVSAKVTTDVRTILF
jgi:Endomembrane protein 70